MISKTPSTCSTTVESKPAAIEGIYQKILERMKTCKFSQDDIFAVHLAFEEAFHNAVEHGNNNNPTKKITVDFLVDNDKVEIQLTDQGEGFNPAEVPDPRVGENLYRLKGRGVLLINAYMDIIEFNEQGNSIYMSKRRTE